MKTIQENYWYVASYPKSGNTWCRILIYQYIKALETLKLPKTTVIQKKQPNFFKLNSSLNTGMIASSRHWIDDQIGIESSDLTYEEIDKIRNLITSQLPINYRGLRYHKIHDAFVNPFTKCNPSVSYKGCNGVIYLTRNPKDIVISIASHFLNFTYEKSVDFLLNKEAYLASSDVRGDYQVRQYIGRWDTHVESWIGQNKIPLLLIRYEDMMLNPFKEFNEIIKFLGLPLNGDLLNQTVLNCSFKNLRNKEISEGGFVERLNKKELFFRSGKIGEGEKLLSSSQKGLICKRFRTTLEKLNYI